MDEGGDRLDVIPLHFRADPAFNLQLHPGGDNQQFDRFAPPLRWRPAMVDNFEALDGAFGFDMNAVQGEDPRDEASAGGAAGGNGNSVEDGAQVIGDHTPVENVVKESGLPVQGEKPAGLEKEAKHTEPEDDDDSFPWWDEFADSDSDFTSDSV